MDTRHLISVLSKRTGIEPAQTEQLLRATVSAITEGCAGQNTVAIPAFGSFISEKEEEYSQTDPQTGQRTLYPPCIRVQYRPSVVLRKQIAR